jgi:hypothetical protein
MSLGVRLMIHCKGTARLPGVRQCFHLLAGGRQGRYRNWRQPRGWRHTVGNALTHERAEGAREPLETLVRDFNEDRHLQASLTDNADATITASTFLSPSEPPLRWSYRLLASTSMVARVDTPFPSNAFLLEADFYSEIAKASRDIVLLDVVLATLCAVLSMACWTIGRALRLLHGLSAVFSRIGDGDYAAPIVERGPLEPAQICGDFNQMGRRLGEMGTRSWYLTEQLAMCRRKNDRISRAIFTTKSVRCCLPSMSTRPQSANARNCAHTLSSQQVSMRSVMPSVRCRRVLD